MEHRADYSATVNHLQDFIDPPKAKQVVEASVRLLRQLEEDGLTFTTIAFRGISGALIAPMIAAELGKSLMAVRKDHPTGHGSNAVEGDQNAKQYIIVDDFIATGKTIREIIQAVSSSYGRAEAMCVGVLQAYYFLRPEYKMYNTYSETFTTTLAAAIEDSLKGERVKKLEKRRIEREESEKQLAKLAYKRPLEGTWEVALDKATTEKVPTRLEQDRANFNLRMGLDRNGWQRRQQPLLALKAASR